MEEEIRRKWERLKLYEGKDLAEGEKFYITAAFPYPNSPQHIGHARTYTITDVYARFKRMTGKNVLFPMGFHVTGTPILAMAQRVKEGDEELIKIFTDIYNIPKEKIKELTDPVELVTYFAKEIEEGMKELGLSIDWRRKFYTFDKHFNKFIEWQFKKLKEKGLLVKGEHYVAWSPKLDSAVGAHDTKGDIDPEIEEMTVILFPLKGEEAFIAISTYRPETIYGVTNLWVKPEGEYLYINLNGRRVVFSKESWERLKYQLEGGEEGSMRGEDLLGKEVENPITEEVVPILPAEFVDLSFGTGAVMSVPGHAVYDYIALKDLGKDWVKVIISSPSYKDIPAKEVAEKYDIKNQLEKEKLEKATKELYREELTKGVMEVEELKGMPVREAREKVKAVLSEKGFSFPIYVISNGPVYSRAGDEVVVKKVKDQWFIDYGNKEWKEKTKEYLERMRIIPEEAKKQMLSTVDWLQKKACTRSRGLGTQFPFDKSQVIESLSDSTIYMAFYTLMPEILEFSPEELTEDFFDYVFLGKGKAVNELHEKLRKKFLYWYPLDSRHSGADLVRNHLVFFVMNHIAIFPEELWPKQIVVNGFVLMEGKKMSKSLGNILPLRKAIKSYGADTVRMAVISGAELTQDTNFSNSIAEGIRERLEDFKEWVKLEEKDDSWHYKWLKEKLNDRLKGLREKYENFKLRELALDLFYGMHEDIKWYLRKKGKQGGNLKEVILTLIKALAPMIPYTAEEIWERASMHGSIHEQPLPEEEEPDKDVLNAEEIVKTLYEDLIHVMKLYEKKPEKLTIILPKAWKWEFIEALPNIKEGRKIAEENNGTEALEVLVKFYMKNRALKERLPTRETLKEAIENSVEFFKREFNLSEVLVEEEEEKHGEKGIKCHPYKPGLILE